MTNRATSVDTLESVLSELDQLQERESAVLRAMDRDAIDAITTEKEALCDRLRAVMQHERPAPHHEALLARVRRTGTVNQLLLVHARDTVRSILAQASGAPMDSVPGGRKPVVQDGVRVNLRG